ncbi:MAG: 2-oxoacid:acceptor oxidoreductase family protein [Victivallales bacterium]|nr:2-oxoacid:acceptor oxidoreductase family protein [Victivallales bacterium]
MDRESYRIIFSGSGGQGVITAAIVMAEAAALHNNLYAIQTQSYGPEARGSATRSDVIISSSEIYYPKVINPHILVCLTQEAYTKFSDTIIAGGLIIYDPYFVKPALSSDAVQQPYPMYDSIVSELNAPITLNICMLGAFTERTKIISEDSMLKVIEKRMPPKFIELNKSAFKIGVKLAKEVS